MADLEFQMSKIRLVAILIFSLVVLFSLPACDSGGKGHWDDAGENWKRK